jgi:hypothetical protein
MFVPEEGEAGVGGSGSSRLTTRSIITQMKRWSVWIALALLAALAVLFSHSRDPNLLQDSDTAFLLTTIREKKAPLSWFMGDWPLQNHFYRPLPTLTFELDNALYHNNGLGYGWTNAILAALCVMALFWFLAELSSSPVWSLIGTALFAIWNLDKGGFLPVAAPWICGAIVLVGLYRHSLSVGKFLPAALVVFFLAGELVAPQVTTPRALGESVIGWLPGRTASVMTLFALTAMAAYARYERARDDKLPLPEATPIDRPTATRSGTHPVPKHAALWLLVSLIGAAAALASYEQAIMLPAVLLAQAVYLKLRERIQPNWKVHVAFWALLAGYFVLRHFALPAGISRYQAQQLRHGPGVWIDLSNYILPNSVEARYLWVDISVSLLLLVSTTALLKIASVAATATTIYQARKNWPAIVTGWVLSLIAFLPMAWANQFGHYHYWPLALRTIFILGVGKLAWDLISIAASRPELTAPPRPSPAPGSLPHL